MQICSLREIPHVSCCADYCRLSLAGILYTITDVQELGEWMKATLDSHPLFKPLTDEELVTSSFILLLWMVDCFVYRQ